MYKLLSILKGLIVSYITVLGMNFGAFLMINSKMPQPVSLIATENSNSFVLIFIPAMTILSIAVGEVISKKIKNYFKAFAYIFLFIFIIFNFIDFIEQFIFAEKVVLGSLITHMYLNIFPVIFAVSGVRIFWSYKVE